MGRHKEWRVNAKKVRRKRIRQQQAQLRDELIEKDKNLRESSPRYQVWKTEQDALEIFQRQEEARLQTERHIQWENDEKRAQQDWKELQERISKARENKAVQDLRIREEWEIEQKRVKEVEEAANKIQVEKQQKQDELMQQIDDFISKGGDLPAAANVPTETNPNMPVCPFFSKTGACRFLDRCSRNHPRPGISKVLLICSFYSHFGMDHSMQDEYDTDLLLEYDDVETYQHFQEFYNDVLPEFETCGRVVQFKVCRNFEPHLRGNVYIEFASARDAVRAFQKFHGRWYGGRQLNAEFTCIQSWKSAICGLFFKGSCPKGKSCNFLHVFRNPRNEFKDADFDRNRFHHRSANHNTRSISRSHSSSRHRSHRSPDSSKWRWSESPEPDLLTENVQTNGHRRHSSSSRKRHSSYHKDRGSKHRELSSGQSDRASKSRTDSKRLKDPSRNSQKREKKSRDWNEVELATDRDISSKDSASSAEKKQDNRSEVSLRMDVDLPSRSDSVMNKAMDKGDKDDLPSKNGADSPSRNNGQKKSESSKRRKKSKTKSHRKERRRKSRSKSLSD